MYISAPTVDDLLRAVLERLVRSRRRVDASRGENIELTGVLLRLTNPRARLSRTEKKGTAFSCLGHLLWYLSGSNAIRFIQYYVPHYDYRQDSEDGITVHGGYGPRLLSMRRVNQISSVVSLLKERPSTRRAVVQLINAEDVARHYKEIPCTCLFQFMIRSNRLEMITTMRSNDAFIGLPHDLFAFTMLQEIVANDLGVQLGSYKHFIGSLHLYDRNRKGADAYLDEGFQPTTIEMPPIPSGSPWPAIRAVLGAESRLRRGRTVDIERLNLPPFWADLVRLLHIYQLSESGKRSAIARVKKQMSSHIYDAYIAKKQESRRGRSATSRRTSGA